jgi:DNA-binding NarL/FixJ family response regulator
MAVTVVVGRLEPLIARGLRGLLDEAGDVEIVSTDLAPAALEGEIVRRSPRVAIVGEERGLAEVTRLVSLQPATGVLILANSPTHAFGSELLSAGASCAARSVPDRELLETIRLVASGARVLTRRGMPREIRFPIDREVLTAREKDVLDQFRKGHSLARAAVELGVGVETVRTHAGNLRRHCHTAPPDIEIQVAVYLVINGVKEFIAQSKPQRWRYPGILGPTGSQTSAFTISCTPQATYQIRVWGRTWDAFTRKTNFVGKAYDGHIATCNSHIDPDLPPGA